MHEKWELPKGGIVPVPLAEQLHNNPISDVLKIESAKKHGFGPCVCPSGDRVCSLFVGVRLQSGKPLLICRNGPIIGLMVYVSRSEAEACSDRAF